MLLTGHGPLTRVIKFILRRQESGLAFSEIQPTIQVTKPRSDLAAGREAA